MPSSLCGFHTRTPEAFDPVDDDGPPAQIFGGNIMIQTLLGVVRCLGQLIFGK